VYVTSNGQLGVLSSSRRFKQDIRNIGDSSDNLMRLRPVSFFYKQEYANGLQTLQYGLIAEEVAKVYPELVEFSDNGEPYTVRYNLLISMILNELQKQYHQENGQRDTINQQDEKLERQQQQIEELQKQNSEMQQRLSRLEMFLLKQNAALVDSASPETATTPSR
jgi:septal ring factor EnvC (AmiA/AmiB activator)